MVKQIESSIKPKFTRGEKCIFAHLVFTFTITIVLAIIYFVHLYVKDHTLQDVFISRRSFATEKANAEMESIPIGKLIISGNPMINVCNTLLLAPRWSVCPGHCVAMRSEPDLSHLLYAWAIRYKYDTTDVKIQKNIVHPHFERDTYANNIGLLQHVTVRGAHKYSMPRLDNRNIQNYERRIFIVAWNYDGSQQRGEAIEIYPAEFMNEENCSTYMAPIIDLRSYEFCTTFVNNVNTFLSHGAVIVDEKNSHVIGFFAWGESQEKFLPLVILNFTSFHEWLAIVTTL